MGMEQDLRLGTSEGGHKLEIDIRKILAQMGLDVERWPQEWREWEDKKIAT
ncbi:hypothetical protein [Cohnella caldifontis]|uniref:hypothetical protein n=1 Tax=Cohnella caldifontis TaxID=3027471 RepID=UPI0023EB49AD|nr:hypothetical protein [Cohnella sp. YIM B05605]